MLCLWESVNLVNDFYPCKMDNFQMIFFFGQIKFVCIEVAMCHLVHDVDTMFHHC